MSAEGLGSGAALVHAVVGVGTVVVLPLGLRLLGRGVVPRPSSVLWPLAGLAAAIAVWLPVGPGAGVLALPFAVAAAVLAGAGVRVVLRPSAPGGPGALARARRPAVATALLTPAVGAAALVAERAGWGLLGFGGDYLTLTVPHMLYAGFGACLVVGLLADRAHDDAGRRGGGVLAVRLGDVAAVAVPAGVLLVLAGYFVSDAAELAGAVVLTAALWCAAVAVLVSTGRSASTEAPAGRGVTRARTARVLLRTGAGVVLVAMLPALWWALGQATGLPHPSLAVTAATHGVGNALGFVLCTLLGLRLVRAARRGSTERAGATGHPAAGDDGPVGRSLLTAAPPGFRRSSGRWRVGRADDGLADVAALGEDLLTWRIHEDAGVRVETDGPVEPGRRVTSRPGVGPLRLTAPCVTVALERSVHRTAFAYEALPGHPLRGEEMFAVEQDADGVLWFVVDVWSRPVGPWLRAVGPAVAVGQRAYVLTLVRAARRRHDARRRRSAGLPGPGVPVGCRSSDRPGEGTGAIAAPAAPDALRAGADG